MEVGMYQIEEFVDHKHCGVCRVKDIAALSGDVSGLRYYVLEPLYGEDRGTILRVPVTNTNSLSPVLTKEDAISIIKSWPKYDDSFYEMDSKKRKLNYESAISNGDIKAIAPLLEGVKRRKLSEGHLTSMDQQFLNRAEPLLFGELAIALGIPYEEVDTFIRENVK